MSSAIPAGMVGAGHAASLYWDGTSTGVDADGGDGTWSTGPAANWDTAATSGGQVPWADGSDAVFGGTGGVVTVSGTVSATSLSFTSPSYRVTSGQVTLTGTPTIDTGANNVSLESVLAGSAAISKTGTGTLTLTGQNTFSGVFTISAGRASIGNLSAFGGTTAGTTISPGATLDVNGLGGSRERFTFSGTGVGGSGAIVNNGAGTLSGLQALTMVGDASIGGVSNWGITSGGSFIMNGNTLTKVGMNDILLSAQLGNPGNFDIKGGSFWIMGESGIFGTSANTVTVRPGAVFGVAGSFVTSVRPWSVILEAGSTWRASYGYSANWTGPVTVQGATTFDVTTSTALVQKNVLSGAGSVTKTGTGSLRLEEINTYTGGTTVNGGDVQLSLSAPWAGGAAVDGTVRGAVTVNAGGSLTLAKENALGTTAGKRVNPLNVVGGKVFNYSDGSNSAPVINLTGGMLLSSGAVPNDPTALAKFEMSGNSVINALAAAAPSVISGRVHLGAGNAGNSSVFNIADGAAVEDLRIEAAITGASAANGITKLGGGILALYGPAVFTGPTLVQEGEVLVDGPHGRLEDSVVSVSSGAGFGTTVAGKTLAGITAQGGSSLLLPALPALTGGATVVKGALNFSGGNVKIRPLIGADTPTGTYDLVVAGSITGSGTPVLDLSGAVGPTRATGSLVVNGNKLQLILTGTGGVLTWNNASEAGAASGSWDFTRANFSSGVGSERFQAFDSVTFNDSVAPGSAKTIALGEVLAPARVTVDNSNGDYTFNGAGRLIGMGSLVKSGTGKLTVAGADSYAMNGSITGSGGVLDFTGKEVFTTALLLKSGGAINNAVITAGTVELQSGSMTASLISSAPWMKSTAGTVNLASNNHLTGPGVVAAGNLVVGDIAIPGLSGTVGSSPVAISNGAAVTFIRGGVNGTGTVDIPNSFSGGGGLNFVGPANPASFYAYLKGNNANLTGPVSATSARLYVTAAGQLGSGPVTLTGSGGLDVTDATLSNAISFIPTGTTVGNLSLTNSTVTGPITVPGGVSTSINLADSLRKHSFVTGPIGESGGAANVSLSASSLSSLTLSGASTYTGSTYIGGSGKVNLTGSLGATAVTVGAMTTLAGNGTIGAGGALTFSNRGVIEIGTTGGGLTVNGNVTLGAITTVGVDVKAGAVASGPIPVLNYTGTLTGSVSNLVMDYPSIYRKAEFAVTPSQITVDLGSKALVWKGINEYWDSTTVKNWSTTNGGAATESFFKGDSVVFNDSGSGGVVRWMSTSYAQPSSMLVDNTTKDYGIGVVIEGACSIVKRGTGRLSLTGYNTYTGGTTVEAGTLQMASPNPVGSGPLTVAAGATLTGDESVVTGLATIAGALDPALPGESWVHNMTFGSLILSGSYLCQLDQSSSDLIEVNGDLNLTGATLVLDKTSTFNTPASYTIATYTGTLTGGFTSVSGMPPGHALKYDNVEKKILVVRVSYADWIAGYPGLSDTTDGGDPDGDGLANLVEYVVGGNPGVADSSVLPTQMIEGDKLVFRYKRNDSSRETTTQTVQWSPDMVNWTDIPIPLISVLPVIITTNGDQPDDVKVSITRIPGSMYVRLKVVQK